MKNRNLNKRIYVLGHISLDGLKHQSKQIVYRGGCCQHSTQDSTKTLRRQSENCEKQIIIVGGIGMNDRRNRDDGRVLGRQGLCYSLKAHIAKDKPLVLRKWKRKL